MFEPVSAVRENRWKDIQRRFIIVNLIFGKSIRSGKINFFRSNEFNHKSTKIILCVMAISCVETGSWRCSRRDYTSAFAVRAFVIARCCPARFCPARFCYCVLLSARFCWRRFVGVDLSCTLLSGHLIAH